MRASQEGHVGISKALLESGVEVNRRNHEGMNALMLASQRGHAEIVVLLIRAGAVMDEQTAQGSTALMLACKRGHEKCAEVLVSMGAEIFMRDRRFRTARDTATRRNHLALLCWLDTQVQVKQIQQFRQKIRENQIKQLRIAYNQGTLQLPAAEAFLESVIEGARRQALGGVREHGVSLFIRTRDQRNVEAFEQFKNSNSSPVTINGQASVAPFTARNLEFALKEIDSAVNRKYLASRSNVPNIPKAASAAPKAADYADWLWPILLLRFVFALQLFIYADIHLPLLNIQSFLHA